MQNGKENLGVDKIPVMVTGVGGGGHGEQILKALRMAETPYFIVGGDMNEYSMGLAHVDVPYILPPANAPTYIDAILNVCRRHGVRALFHGSEPELKAMSAARDRIAAAGVFLPINPRPVIDLCMDKLKLINWLGARGFDVPKTVYVETEEDLGKVDFCPAVLKPTLGGGGSANVLLAQDEQELLFLGRSLLGNIGPYIAQEYMGTVESEYTVGVLSDMDGRLINSIAVRRMIMSGLSNRIKVRNRTGKAELGAFLAISSGVSQGDVGRFPEVTGPCEAISQALKATGVINVQCRFVNGRVYVFEINPRFSGTTSLRAMMGYNEPDCLLRQHVLGEEPDVRFPYRCGRIVRGLSEIVISGGEIAHAE